MSGLSIAAIIPNYNYARFLPKAVDSVLAQTQPFDEIIVVDDGSTDESLQVLAAYKDKVKVISITNSGQLGAIRAGIAASSADYVYTLDADDFATDNLVERVKPILPRKPVKVMFQLYGVNQDGVSLDCVFPTFPSNYNSAAMIEDNGASGFYTSPPTSGNVFSREALERLGFGVFDARGVIDGSPSVSMPYLGEIAIVCEPLAYYRIHNSSMSSWSNPTLDLLKKEIDIFNGMWREVKDALPLDAPAFEGRSPVYIEERNMMIACKRNQLFVLPEVWKYLTRMLPTHLSVTDKFVLSAWAISLLAPVPALRDRAILIRRSSANRSKRMQVILNLLRAFGRRS